jgi:hypothetical protein
LKFAPKQQREPVPRMANEHRVRRKPRYRRDASEAPVVAAVPGRAGVPQLSSAADL